MIFARNVLRPPRREPGAANVLSDLLTILLVTVIIAGAATGQALVAALGATALLVAVVARLWSRLSLERVEYLRELSQSRVFAGDEVQLLSIVENRKRLPLPWLRVRDQLPEGIEHAAPEQRRWSAAGGTELVMTTSIAGRERVRRRSLLIARRRGFYRMGPASLESGDLFGLYTSRKEQHLAGPALVVYPVPQPMPDFHLPPARPVGDARSLDMIWADPNRPLGVREYVAGDAVKSIDWKATARLDRLHVKTFEPSVTRYVLVLLEASTADRPWDGYQPEVLEACVTAAASLAVRVTELGYQVGLLTNGVSPGEDGRNEVPPASGAGQLPSILETLAMVRPMTVKGLEEMVASGSHALISHGTTVIYVAGILRPAAVEMLSRLTSTGHQALFAWVGREEPPAIARVSVIDCRSRFGIAAADDRFRRPQASPGPLSVNALDER